MTGKSGIGEINMFRGLSCDDRPDFEAKLIEISTNTEGFVKNFHDKLIDFPSVRFGLEMALKDMEIEDAYRIFENDFTNGISGIPINGLIWMGDIDFMKKQINDKLEQGFHCLKMKIGALNFEDEYTVLKSIRESYSSTDLELRVDANGAFTPIEAPVKLDRLSKLKLHSIEQPIKQGQWEEMQRLCRHTPIPIALDEELIGIHIKDKRKELLDLIKPQYIILKPSLLGGFLSSKEWIKLAEERSIAWWITSALESNIGLNAIAQWTASLDTNAYQGLGTGLLYENNIESPLYIKGDQLFYNSLGKWQNINFDE